MSERILTKCGELHIANTSAPIIIKIPNPPVTIDGHEIPETGMGAGEAVGFKVKNGLGQTAVGLKPDATRVYVFDKGVFSPDISLFRE